MPEIHYNSDDIHTSAWQQKILDMLDVSGIFEETPEYGNAEDHDYAVFKLNNEKDLYFDVYHPIASNDPQGNKYKLSVWEDLDGESFVTKYDSQQIKEIIVNKKQRTVTFVNDMPDEDGVIKVVIHSNGKVVSIGEDGKEVILCE